MRAGRRGIGIELKPSYFRQAVKNIAAAASEVIEQGGLFDEVQQNTDETEEATA